MAERKKEEMLQVNITVPAKNVSAVAAELEKDGLEVDSVLREIGVITGRVAKSKVDRLKQRPGITVEEDQSVQLPPPDAPIQ